MFSVEELQRKFYRNSDHPYHVYERKIESLLHHDFTLLDAGCGRTVPVLVKYKNRVRRLIGVDLEDPEDVNGIEYLKSDMSNIIVDEQSVDLVISRAVLEHIREPEKVFNEIARVLKKNGHFIFLIPNLWDYASLLSMALPNNLHPKLVSAVTGRKMDDTFPAYYKVNTRNAIIRIAGSAGFRVESFEYLGQYPSYLKFNRILFLIGILYEKTVSRFKALNFLSGWILVDLVKQ